MTTITLLEHQFQYNIIYQKNRKTIKIKIDSPTQIEITAPTGYPRKAIEEMLTHKSTWLIKQLDTLAIMAKNPVNKTLTEGAQLLFLGQPRKLTILNTALETAVALSDETIEVRIAANAPPLATVLFEWYVKNAGTTLAEKTKYWATQIGVQPQRLTIRDQKTRWGSCSTRGNINYNWRIIMAPEEIIDYLVVHELCHLEHPNHSLCFWQLVERFIPDCKARRHWLRENGSLFSGIFS
ncbi:MAG: M48 family metallopeptidase [Pelosinus sp.]|nr:M48 family metallopeptidase [Pelosinus sp.]